MAVTGIIFDIDGVLIDSFAAHLQSWRLLAGEIGATVTEGQFAQTFGRTSRDIIALLFGVSDPAQVRRLDDRKEALYRDLIRGAVPAAPGAVEALRRLHAAGFRLAVGSSGPPENVALVCQELGLDRFLSAKVTGADVQHGKPDPQVFLLAAERMGAEPRACVVVEDAPAGIEAARRAGMHSVALLGTHAATALAQADRVFESLDAITPELVVELTSDMHSD
jgi:beta-phosphoglucomutase